MRLSFVSLLIAISLLLTITPSRAMAADTKRQSMTGFWVAEGVNQDGPYKLFAQTFEKDGILYIRWIDKGEQLALGTGYEKDGRIVFGYSLPPSSGALPGVVVYKHKGKTLVGEWTLFGLQRIYTETLTPTDPPTSPHTQEPASGKPGLKAENDRVAYYR